MPNRIRAVALLIGWVLLTAAPCLSFAQVGLVNRWVYDPIQFPESIAYSADGKLFAIAGTGGVQICSSATGSLETCIPTSAGQVGSVAFSPDGTTLALGGNLGSYGEAPAVVEVWNYKTTKLLRSLPTAANSVESVAFSPDGSILVDGGVGNVMVEMWNASTGASITPPATSLLNVESVQFSPDGSTLALGGYSLGYSVELWNVSNDTLLHAIPAGASDVRSIAFSPDGKSLAVGGSDYINDNTIGVAELWSVPTGQIEAVLPTNDYIVACVAFSPDGKTVAVGEWVTVAFDGAVSIYSASTYNLVSTLQSDAHPEIHWLAFSPDGTSLALAGLEYVDEPGYTVSKVETWNLASSGLISTCSPDPYNSSFSIAYSPDGNSIALGAGVGNYELTGGWIGIWDVATQQLTKTFNSSASGGATSVALSSDGKTLADCGLASNYAPILELWNIATGALITTLPTAAKRSLTSLAFSPDGTILADGGSLSNDGTTIQDGVLELWSVAGGTLIANLATAANAGVTSLAFSPDGKKLAISGIAYSTSGFQYGVLEVWDVAGQKLLASLPTNLYSITAVAFSPDGDTIADGGIQYVPNLNATKCSGELWSFSAETLLSFLPVAGTATSIASLTFSPDASTVLAATNGGIQAFDTSAYTLIAILGIGQVDQVAMSPDGTQLAYTNPYCLLSVNSNPFMGLTAVAGLTVSPAVIAAGGTSIGTVTLNHAAPAGGIAVELISNNEAASVPSAVTIPTGAKTATFTINSGTVDFKTIATITAGRENSTKAAALTITPESLTGVSLGVKTIVGGNSCPGTITIGTAAGANGVTVSLAVTGSTASAPATVTVPSGQTSAPFTVTTTGVGNPTSSTITATYIGVSKMAKLAITPAGLESITLNPSTVPGGTATIATVSISGEAPANGFTIKLASSSRSATVPGSVTIPAGQVSANVAVGTSAVPAQEWVTIAAIGGIASAKAKLIIDPPDLTSLSVSPASVSGGQLTTGTVTIGSAAPAGGIHLALSTNNSAAAVPTTVIIPAGGTSATFSIRTKAVKATTAISIKASFGGASKSATLTIS